ncbi:DNA-binding protein MutS2 [uncultured archaeon]|nr:DNA-binding protein MutS2 [uncultured archaeon]
MREEVLKFIQENNLSLFDRNTARSQPSMVLKTKDAKDVYSRVLDLISDNFIFSDTKQILKLFNFADSEKEIEKRQAFFKTLPQLNNSELRSLQKIRPFWKPKYDVCVVTESESTLIQLQKLGCPVVFINSDSDLNGLERYDLVQVIDCENYETALERLPQSVFIDDIENVYLERFLSNLSGWKFNIEKLDQLDLNAELSELRNKLKEILPLIEEKQKTNITQRDIEVALDKINSSILNQIKNMTLSGDSVISLLSKGIPKEIQILIEKEISTSGIPEELFDISVPLRLEEKEVENYLKRQSTQEFTNSAAMVKKHSAKIKEIPNLLKKLEQELIYFDFIAGISKFNNKLSHYPKVSSNLEINKSKNLFLSNAQPISFNLKDVRCSILTGANSGGKTTLIEHIIQLVSLSLMGMPVSGETSLPIFSEVYYFAKNKGSMSKGAFETLLTQMSEINPGERTLILADEIEAVTEPGVAGEIIVSTAEYFLDKNCFLIIATHLGQEIKDFLPKNCRIDGIEAKGLTENYELIVDHNPVLGRLANSTPELIVEKMAKSLKKDYFLFLYESLRKRNGT